MKNVLAGAALFVGGVVGLGAIGQSALSAVPILPASCAGVDVVVNGQSRGFYNGGELDVSVGDELRLSATMINNDKHELWDGTRLTIGGDHTDETDGDIVHTYTVMNSGVQDVSLRLFGVRFVYWGTSNFDATLDNDQHGNGPAQNRYEQPQVIDQTCPAFRINVEEGQEPHTQSDWQASFWNLPNTSYLTSPPSFPQGSPVHTAEYEILDLDLGLSSPHDSVNPDRFVARFTKSITVEQGGYEFSTRSDDGVRMYVDDELIIDQWNDHAATYHTAIQHLKAGTHQVVVEYYENGYDAVIQANVPQSVESPDPVTYTYEDALEQCMAYGPQALVFNTSRDTNTLTSTNARTEYLSTGLQHDQGYSGMQEFGPYRAHVVTYTDDYTAGNRAAVSVELSDHSQITDSSWYSTTELAGQGELASTLVNGYFHPGLHEQGSELSVRFVADGDIGNSSVQPVCLVLEPVPDDIETPELTAELVIDGYDNADDQLFFGSIDGYKTPASPLISLSPDGAQQIVGVPSGNFGPGGSRRYLSKSVDRFEPVYNGIVIGNPEHYELVSVTGDNCDEGGYQLAYAVLDRPVQDAHCIFTVNYIPNDNAAVDSEWAVEYWNLPNSYLTSPPTVPSRPADAQSSEPDQNLAYDWGTNVPHPGVQADRFVVRASRTITLTDGDHTIRTLSDDGVRVYVNGSLWIDEWNDHGATAHSATNNLASGEHEIVVEYYENGYDAVLELTIE